MRTLARRASRAQCFHQHLSRQRPPLLRRHPTLVRTQHVRTLHSAGSLSQGHTRSVKASAGVPMESLHQSRCVGALLWNACADALGAAVEGQRADEIKAKHPRGITSYLETPRGYGHYTDDTQMALALTESLITQRTLDPAHVSRQYATRFEQHRGYGGTAQKILRDLQSGDADWRTVATRYIPQGSYANGGAMRIAPLGLAYRHAPPPVLRSAVEGALACTHVHPEAIDGAVVIAAAVAWLAKLPPAPAGTDCACAWRERGWGEGYPGHRTLMTALIDHLLTHTQTEEMASRLRALKDMVPEIPGCIRDTCTDPSSTQELSDTWAAHLSSPAWQAELARCHTLQSAWFRIRAVDAVAVALCAFAHHGFSPQPASAVVAAVHVGGDTDTVAAIVGALVGAFWGRHILPAWYVGLESGHELGREGIVRLGRELATLDIR